MTELKPLEYITVETGTNPKYTVIWLHGLGADGHDFEGIVPELGLPAERSFRFIFPHAPVIPVTINGGYQMRAWYDILKMDFRREVDGRTIQHSCQLVKNLIESQIETGTQSEHICLAGFSQGGVIAAQLGVTLPYRIAGVICLSSYVADTGRIMPAVQSANAKTPFFFAHGEEDNVVPFELGQEGADFLTNRATGESTLTEQAEFQSGKGSTLSRVSEKIPDSAVALHVDAGYRRPAYRVRGYGAPALLDICGVCL
ncbi:hypothetical protein CHS0354_018393 [Potamilus streckersoni]|uniref:palmitoyl-protein hydrolase n=1 Tax=Potamilus streckersoni TaxID=2493646 RepID=A0AAE0TBH6_9BIVA|nr:hypothetical protein CHS0354_018393 [Potamilus streckersoni]